MNPSWGMCLSKASNGAVINRRIRVKKLAHPLPPYNLIISFLASCISAYVFLVAVHQESTSNAPAASRAPHDQPDTRGGFTR